MEAEKLKTNCLFYGRNMYVSFSRGIAENLPFVLLDSTGNQCGLQVGVHAPCHMEVNGEPVEWRECPYVKMVRMEPV